MEHQPSTYPNCPNLFSSANDFPAQTQTPRFISPTHPPVHFNYKNKYMQHHCHALEIFSIPLSLRSFASSSRIFHTLLLFACRSPMRMFLVGTDCEYTFTSNINQQQLTKPARRYERASSDRRRTGRAAVLKSMPAGHE